MNKIDILVEKHLNKKPGENLQALRGRYEEISGFHQDPLTAAILATSYYGMEELHMRLPRMNDILRNPFSREENLHAITGLIMAADGGPAEGAKAIQIYMALQAQGMIPEETKAYHMLALLAISCKRAMPLAAELMQKMKDDADVTFYQASMDWLREEQARQEITADERSIAYALLVGMREEVETIFDEEL